MRVILRTEFFLSKGRKKSWYTQPVLTVLLIARIHNHWTKNQQIKSDCFNSGDFRKLGTFLRPGEKYYSKYPSHCLFKLGSSCIFFFSYSLFNLLCPDQVHCPADEEPGRDDEPHAVGVRHSREEGHTLGGWSLQGPDHLQGWLSQHPAQSQVCADTLPPQCLPVRNRWVQDDEDEGWNGCWGVGLVGVGKA